MRLLTAHKILIAFALLLGVVLTSWGAVHGLARHEQGAWIAFVFGVIMIPAAGLYLYKLKKRPPIR
jgi:hypothetical protein